MIKNILLASALSVALLTGCNDPVATDLFQIANVLVQVECGTQLNSATGVVTNVLNVVGGTQAGVQSVINVLETNVAVAKQLCPSVEAIVAAVGTLPTGTPTVIATAAKAEAPGAEAVLPFPVTWVSK